MPERIATVIGATGFIGRHLIHVLQSDKRFTTIRAIVRKPEQFSNSKVEMKLVNFNEPESLKMAIDGSDAVFCAVGTTQKKVKGDKAAYRKVDFDIPAMAARFCAETDCPQLLLVSAVGADPRSSNFYLRLKGEADEAVKKENVRSISIFRPSVLLGERAEKRPAERIAQSLISFFGFLLVGTWEKYRGIDGAKLAEAMMQAAFEQAPGVTIYEYTDIQLLLKRHAAKG